MDKYAEVLDGFMKATLVVQLMVIMVIGFLFLISAVVFLNRMSKSNDRVINSLTESNKESKDAVKTLTGKLEAAEAQREQDRKQYTTSIESFSSVMQAEQQIKLHQLSFEKTRTEAQVNTYKALDGMRTENFEFLEKTLKELELERTNVEQITAKIDTQATSLSNLVTVADNLPVAVASAVKGELGDVRLMVERLNSFLDNFEASKAEMINRFDQAKSEVIGSINALQVHLAALGGRVGDAPLVGTAASTTPIPTS